MENRELSITSNEENYKEEIINGRVYMSASPNTNHIRVKQTLFIPLLNFFKEKCEVVLEGGLYLTTEDIVELKKDKNKLDELIKKPKNEVIPDVAVYCDKEQRVLKGYIGVPQLIIEILSPSNSSHDHVTKKELYEKFGVPEYWIIDPIQNLAFIFELKENRYELVYTIDFLTKDIQSARFKDLKIDLSKVELLEEDIY